MISTAVAPRFCKTLEAGAFDAYSARNVRRLIDLAEQIEASIGTDSNKYQVLCCPSRFDWCISNAYIQMILKTVYTVFDDATSNAEGALSPFVKLNRSPFDPEGVPARRRLLCRGVKLLENMLRWRKYAGDRHAIGQLCVRLVNDCILPIAENGWEVGGKQKISQVLIRVLACHSTSSYSTCR